MQTFQQLNQVPRSTFQPACAWVPGDHDRDAAIVNCRSGLLIVTPNEAELTEPPSKTDGLCFGSQIMAAYDPKAKCPTFEHTKIKRRTKCPMVYALTSVKMSDV